MMNWLVIAMVGAALAVLPTAAQVRLLNDQAVGAGGEITIIGNGFGCTTATATLAGSVIGSVRVKADGSVFTDLTIPPDFPAGDHQLKISCVGTSDTALTTVRVVTAKNRQRLAVTPTSARPGEVVTIDGTSFDDCIDTYYSTNDGNPPAPVSVTITMDGTAVAAAQITESSPGRATFRTTFVVPPGIDVADHPVVATCRNRYLPGSSTATATLTVGSTSGPSPTAVKPGGGGGPRPGGEGSGSSAPQIPIGAPPIGSGSGPGVGIAGIGVIAVVAAIGLVGLRRRLRPAGAAPSPPIPRRSPGSQRLPDVVARSARLGSGPARVTPGPGRDVSVRVVAHSGGAG